MRLQGRSEVSQARLTIVALFFCRFFFLFFFVAKSRVPFRNLKTQSMTKAPVRH